MKSYKQLNNHQPPVADFCTAARLFSGPKLRRKHHTSTQTAWLGTMKSITLCDCPCCVVALSAKVPTSWTMSHCTMSNIDLPQKKLASKKIWQQQECVNNKMKKNGCCMLEMWPFIRGQPCKWRNEKVSMMTLDFGLSTTFPSFPPVCDSSLGRRGRNWAQFYFPKEEIKSLFTGQASSKIANPSIHHQEPTSNI